MSLTRPHLKMSKSHVDPKSRIMITDSREKIERKIKSALTDSVSGISYDPTGRPGVSNLLEILFHLQHDHDQASPQDLAKHYETLTMKAFKECVSECIDRHLTGIRDAFYSLVNGSDRKRLDEAMMLGTSKANESAQKTMDSVRNAIGL
ncbi:MAG: hypothetical protein Q9165_004027 [Trypethelium subeluteriae]